MTFVANAVHHPRKLWIRRALFQIHLWAGVLLSLYIVVIALTGSILVFKDEFQAEFIRTTLPHHLLHLDAAHPQATLPETMRRFAQTFPGAKATDIILPNARVPAFQITAADAHGHAFNAVADPQSGTPHLMPRTWVQWVYDLHVYLLLPHNRGVQVNAIGAAVLLLLALTGILLWWPGLRAWSRGLRINLRANWRRINFDAHNAIGFWTLAIVLWWAISGFYFGFYQQVAAAVNRISPLRNMVPPTPLPAGTGPTRVSLETLLEAAHNASPKGHLYSLSDPSLATTSVYAEMDLRRSGDFTHRDIVALDTTNAHVLSIWHYDQNHSLGDWFLWAQHPLHFGTVWGLGIKILYFILGLTLAILSLTGLLMYWNRYLRHRWRALS